MDFPPAALSSLIVTSLFSTASLSLNSVQDQYCGVLRYRVSSPHWVYSISRSSLHHWAVTDVPSREESQPFQCTWLSVSPGEYSQMNSPLGRNQAAQNHLGIHPLTGSIISTASPTIRNRYPFATWTARCTNRGENWSSNEEIILLFLTTLQCIVVAMSLWAFHPPHRPPLLPAAVIKSS